MAQKLGIAAEGTIVKLNVSGNPSEFKIVHHGAPAGASGYVGFDNATVLFRQATSEEYDWDGDSYRNGYEGGDMFKYTVNTFPGQLDPDIQAVLRDIQVPGVSGTHKAFNPSVNELNRSDLSSSDDDYVSEDGFVFEYFVFAQPEERRAWFGQNTSNGWWTRSKNSHYNARAAKVNKNGTFSGETSTGGTYGCVEAIVLPDTLYVLDDGTLTTNIPPTAPGSIEVTNVVSGGSATITLTAATDPDGTIASYIYERSVDGGAWGQVAQANSLTQTDTIGEEWGTVAYRAAAVDNLGLQGPYITSNTETVNVGWVTIGGPAESMGSKAVPFDFAFSVSVSGQSSTGAITASAALDGKQVYSGTPSAGEQVTIPIKTHLLGAGTHTIEVQANKDDYLPASKRYTFTVPAVTIPDGGVGALAQDPAGRAVYHTTLAQRCIGRDGVDIQAQMDALAARVKTLEG